MRTQIDDLKDLIKNLEAKLQLPVVQSDAFEQQAILKKLDIAKSTLYNISND